MAELSEAEKAEMIASANQTPNIHQEEPQNTAPLSQLGTPAPPDVDFMEDSPGIISSRAPTPVTPLSGQAYAPGDPGEWGPYGDYNIVNTGFGEFAVEKGKILFFEIVERFNRRAGEMMKVRLPRYRTQDQSREDALAEFYSEQARRPVRA